MKENSDLYILWTNDNPVTAEKMVFMYGINSILRGWWDSVTIIVWGATASMVSENTDIQKKVKIIGVDIPPRAEIDGLMGREFFDDLRVCFENGKEMVIER